MCTRMRPLSLFMSSMRLPQSTLALAASACRAAVFLSRRLPGAAAGAVAVVVVVAWGPLAVILSSREDEEEEEGVVGACVCAWGSSLTGPTPAEEGTRVGGDRKSVV